MELEIKLGPSVLAGFIEAPVWLPKINAKQATTEPTTKATIKSLSVLKIVR